ncbi:hypothetical protein HanIR_Chr12g0615051 [Helianthus annuus]|nr:hypothetical protein HanIR_Chr12g0615051 [Helianthus annuus]
MPTQSPMRMNGWIHQRFKRSLVLFYMVYPLILILPRVKNLRINAKKFEFQAEIFWLMDIG